MYNINLISGDGIGREVMDAGEYLLDKIDLEFSFTYGHAGYHCFKKTGTTLPEETVKKAKKSDAILFGAITSTPGQPSPIINLRQKLDMYANLRPIKSYEGVNNSSTVTCNSFARQKAKASVGSYLLFSIALTV